MELKLYEPRTAQKDVEPAVLLRGGEYVQYLVKEGLEERVGNLPGWRQEGARSAMARGVVEALPEVLGTNFLSDIESLESFLASTPPPARFSALWCGVNERLQILYRAWLLVHQDSPELAGLSPREPAHLPLNALLREKTREMVEELLGRIDLSRLSQAIALSDLDERVFRRRLQEGVMRLRTVDFRTTYWCNIACEHCFLSASPQREREKIPDEQIFRVIEEMPGAGMTNIMVGAGEPFVRADLIMGIIAAGRKAGVRQFQLISNGFWGKTMERAKKTCRELAQAGFSPQKYDWLKVSTGVYHVKAGVPVSAMGNIALAFHEQFGVPVKLDCEAHTQADWDAVERELEGLGVPKHIYKLRKRLVGPVGAGGNLVDKISHFRPYEDIEPCNLMDKVAIDPRGRVLPCCGANYDAEALVTNENRSAFGQSLREMVQNIWTNPMLQFMAREKMGKLFDVVGQKPLARGYTSQCDLCEKVFKDVGVPERTHLLNTLQPQADYQPHWLVDF